MNGYSRMGYDCSIRCNDDDVLQAESKLCVGLRKVREGADVGMSWIPGSAR
jgi:hypothetical protein